MEHKLRLEFKDIWPELELVEATCESNWVDFALDSLDHLVSLKVQSGESPQCV